MTVDALSGRVLTTDGAGGAALVWAQFAKPQTDEVLVRIHASGICRTDTESLTWGRPMVLGHEGAGEVVRCGAGVDLAPGTPVALNWAMPCGECFYCVRQDPHLCEHRRGRHVDGVTVDGAPCARSFELGTLADHALVDVSAVVPIPASVPMTSAALLGCAVITGYASVTRCARVEPGATVVVIGAGGVGWNIVQAASIAGASVVVVIDRDSDRLDAARAVGATHAVATDDPLSAAAVHDVRRVTGRGADVAFEATGRPELAAAPLAHVRNGGTAVQMSGNECVAPFDLRLFEWDKRYVNPLYGGAHPADDIGTLCALYDAGRWRLDEQIVDVCDLDDAAEALRSLHAGRSGKVVVRTT
jgi:Zn-dependent alcohol dehydrogenase